MKFAILACVCAQLATLTQAAGYFYERPTQGFPAADVYQQQEKAAVAPTAAHAEEPATSPFYQNSAAQHEEVAPVQDYEEAAAQLQAEVHDQAAAMLHAATAIASELDYAYNQSPAEVQDLSSSFQHYELGSRQKSRRLGPVRRLKFKGASQHSKDVSCGEEQKDLKTISAERGSRRANDRRLTAYTETLVGPEFFEPQAEYLQKLGDFLESQVEAQAED